MNLSLKPKHLKRYKDIAQLLVKYGRGDLIPAVSVNGRFSGDELSQAGAESGKPQELASDLETLGPTFIKLGQVLSTRPGLFPRPYVEALSRLQDEVEPFPFEQVKQIVETELDVRFSRAFQTFDRSPLAAASLGQVHLARLPDARPVAVKVQRPEIRPTILEDLEAFDQLAAVAEQHTQIGRRYRLTEMMKTFRRTLMQELDYRQEAHHLEALGNNIQDFDEILVPQPVDDYTTSRVLTMDYIRGQKVTSLSPLKRIDIDGQALAGQLFEAYLQQVLIDGFFHADPHPGNVFVTEDNRIALIDLGMVARVDPKMQRNLLKLLISIADQRGDKAAEVIMAMGEVRESEVNKRRFTREAAELISRYEHSSIEEMRAGYVVAELSQIATNNGFYPPPELATLGKTLLNLDEIGRILAPEFTPNDVIRSSTYSIMRKHVLKTLRPTHLASTLLEANELVDNAVSRANMLLNDLAEGRFEIGVRAFDETRLMSNLQKIAHRITVGLVLAALIVGAALLMRVETEFTLLGYPGIAMILFLTAASLGFALVVTIMFDKDRAGGSRE